MTLRGYFWMIFGLLLLSHCEAQARSKTESPLPETRLIEFRTGKVINSKDLQGKVLYLDFWASWCVPCRKSFPFMNQLSEQYPQDTFAVIAVNMDETRKAAEQFLQDIPANFTIYTDPTNTLSEFLELPGLPVAYIIDKQGVIQSRHIGFNDRKKAKKIKQIRYLLRQSYKVENND